MAEARARAIVEALLQRYGWSATLATFTEEVGPGSADEEDVASALRALGFVDEACESDPLSQVAMAPSCTEELAITSAHVGNVLCVCLAGSDRQLIASGGVDKTVAISSLPGRGPVASISTHRAPVLSLAAQPRGDLLASTAMDGSVALHSLPDKALVFEQKAHRKYAVQVAWHPAGDMFASCGADGVVSVFRRGDDGSFVLGADIPLSREAGVNSVGWSSNAQDAVVVAAVSGSIDLKYYDVRAQKGWGVSLSELDDDHHSFSAMHLAVHPSSKLISVATDTQRIFIYGWGSRAKIRTLVAPKPVDDFAPSPRQAWGTGGRTLYVANGQPVVTAWDVGMERETGVLRGHTKTVRDVSTSSVPSDRRVVTGGYDGIVRTWMPTPGAPEATPQRAGAPECKTLS